MPTTIADSWFADLTTMHGPAVKDPDLARWTWLDEEWGVYTERLTHVWQVVAWSPHRSVTLRTDIEPTERDLRGVIILAGFTQAVTG